MPRCHPWLEAKTSTAAKETASVSVPADAAANSGIGQSWPPCLMLFSFNSHRSPLAILSVNWGCLQLLGITDGHITFLSYVHGTSKTRIPIDAWSSSGYVVWLSGSEDQWVLWWIQQLRNQWGTIIGLQLNSECSLPIFNKRKTCFSSQSSSS